jgi:hypothetical protein
VGRPGDGGGVGLTRGSSKPLLGWGAGLAAAAGCARRTTCRRRQPFVAAAACPAPFVQRHNHVTPTSYLELLTTLLKLLGEKRAETTAQKRRLEVGLEKLTTTAEQVWVASGAGGPAEGATLHVLPDSRMRPPPAHRPQQPHACAPHALTAAAASLPLPTPSQVEVMQRELQELQPVLASTAAQVEAMMATIASEKVEAAATRAQVQGQEREANEQAAAAKAMAADAQRDLDAALPALDAAVASLKNLSRWAWAGSGLAACGWRGRENFAAATFAHHLPPLHPTPPQTPPPRPQE